MALLFLLHDAVVVVDVVIRDADPLTIFILLPIFAVILVSKEVALHHLVLREVIGA